MLQVTDRALDRLEQLLQESTAEPGEGVTLGTNAEGRLGFGLGRPGGSDQIYERGGAPIMIVPEPLVSALDGYILDYVITPEEEGFTLDRADGGDIIAEDGAPA